MESEQYTLFTSTDYDNIKLTEISIASFKPNPLFYLTYPGGISSEIKDFHHKGMIEFNKGEEVETIKVVADHIPDKPTVTFAIYFPGPKPPKRKLKAPVDANFKFINEVKKQTGPHSQKFYRENEHIKVHLVCALPQYQRKGLGSKLGNYIKARAEELQKRVFVQATPEGTSLYLKLGFELHAEAIVELNGFGGEGTYVQSTISWNPCKRQGGDVNMDGI
ncbi:hypothetical protein DL98DRAFT_474872 [Cadophora sp. DSE1049]|nr:hypothetical protein DL98DRAFT_474872 [Cadophora sp. DSE1049]